MAATCKCVCGNDLFAYNGRDFHAAHFHGPCLAARPVGATFQQHFEAVARQAEESRSKWSEGRRWLWH